jgi:hypothetical protein
MRGESAAYQPQRPLKVARNTIEPSAFTSMYGAQVKAPEGGSQ